MFLNEGVLRQAMKIRRMLSEDERALLHIWRRAVEATHHFLSQADIEAIAKDIPYYLQHVAEVWLAEEAGQAVGFVGTNENRIGMLFIDPAFQGKGMGTALLEHIRVRYGRPLCLDVNEQNHAARAFYEKYGFCQCGFSPVDSQGRNIPLHLNSVSRWIREFEREKRLEARPRGHRPSIFSQKNLEEITKLIKENADIPLVEIRDHFGKNCSLNAIHKQVKALGFVYKKYTFPIITR
jgi:putative acetyltransferase